MKILKIIAVMVVLAMVNCQGTKELGNNGKVMFNLMGKYQEVSGISTNPIGMDLPVFIECEYPDQTSSLQTDLEMQISPAEAANLVRFQKGRFLLIPLQEKTLTLNAMKDNEVYDWIELKSAKVDHVHFKPGFITAIIVKDKKIETKIVDYDFGDAPVCLGTADVMNLTVIPYDKEGTAMTGILDIGVKFDPEGVLKEDVTFPAQDGVVANRVILKPNKDKINKDTLVSVEFLVSYQEQVFSKKFTVKVKDQDSCY